ncbi:MAG: hypothetical protein JWO19_2908 [Bryobacterales bacterium]|nr:hypothetical protein [Bryobacterales bacterium]
MGPDALVGSRATRYGLGQLISSQLSPLLALDAFEVGCWDCAQVVGYTEVGRISTGKSPVSTNFRIARDAGAMPMVLHIQLNALETNRDLYRRKVEPRAPSAGS